VPELWREFSGTTLDGEILLAEVPPGEPSQRVDSAKAASL